MTITLDQWNNNPKLAEALKKDLEKAHWRLALEILSQRSPARTMSARYPEQIVGVGDAIAGKILGYESALQSLRNLALPEEARSPLGEPTYGVESEDQATE